MKIEDPTIAFSKVVANRRQSRAAVDGERFRLGLHGIDCGPTSWPTERSALIGASSWALKTEQVDRTVGLIGLVAGLLADLGFHVCPIGADTRRVQPSIVVWVCGDETQADEHERLAEMRVPGLSLGSCVTGLEDWMFITTEELENRKALVGNFVAKVEALVGSRIQRRDSYGNPRSFKS